jgi:Coenzyme PQQ synthesis protein D (PqqD)
MLPLTSRLKANRDVVFRDLQGELVLLNLKSGVYFGLDPVGTRMWQLLHEHRSLHEVLAALLDEYDVAETRCERDLVGFVRALVENELVNLESGPTA